MSLLRLLSNPLEWAFLLYFILLQLTQLALILRAFGAIRRYQDEVRPTAWTRPSRPATSSP